VVAGSRTISVTLGVEGCLDSVFISGGLTFAELTVGGVEEVELATVLVAVTSRTAELVGSVRAAIGVDPSCDGTVCGSPGVGDRL
jgi:hypothetical protein